MKDPTEAGIRELFDSATWPQLAMIVRHLDAIIMERVGTDPARCAGEQRAHVLAEEAKIKLARVS